jgi:hypothetical protein
MVPTCALPSIAQAVAVRIGGMKKGSVISTSSTPRPGVSVRATIQASRIASASDSTVFTSDRTAVLISAWRFSAVARFA